VVEVNNKLEKCSVCRSDYTSKHVEAAPGIKVYVCDTCLGKAKNNFIWICMSCGKVYIRNKKLVLGRMKNSELRRAFLICEDMQIIQGIDMCIECDPEGILHFMDKERAMAC
jgi:hypothetical protein